MVINRDDLRTAYIDLTGRFQCKYSNGNEYILVAYHYDSNIIIAQALKNRRAETITATWQVIHNMYTQGGIAPNIYVMDNEISTEFIAALTKNDTSYQLVPPHTHRQNLADRVISTFKNYLKSRLASVNPNFPLSKWDRLIKQTNITLNLIRSAHFNPKLSVYVYMFGEFNFVATP